MVTFEFPAGRFAGLLGWGRHGPVWAADVVTIPVEHGIRFQPWPPQGRLSDDMPDFDSDVDDEDDYAEPQLVPMPFEDVADLPCMRRVDHVDFTFRTFDAEIDVLARSMGHVREVSLHDTFITANGLAVLARMPQLRRLSIVDASNLSFSDCASLAESETLEHLRMTLLAGAGPGLRYLSALPQLSSLDLSHSRRVTDADLAELVAVPQLSRLDLRYCTGLTAKAATTLAAMPNLRHVELTGTKITASATARLRTATPQVHVETASGPSLPESSRRPPPSRPERREAVLLRRLRDARIRTAVERRAVSVAVEHLKALGGTNITDVGTRRSWDLECDHGVEQWRIEVKGTQGPLGAVELTENEVLHARRARDGELTCQLGLFICSDITVTGGDDSETPPTATGGNGHWFFPWDIDDTLLHPIAYTFDAHRIPTCDPAVP